MYAISTKKKKNATTKGGGKGGDYVHIQNKYGKEDFQNIIYFKSRKKQNNIIIKIKKKLETVLGTYLLSSVKQIWKLINQHVTSVSQRKNLSVWQDSHLWPPEHQAGTLELHSLSG